MCSISSTGVRVVIWVCVLVVIWVCVDSAIGGGGGGIKSSEPLNWMRLD